MDELNRRRSSGPRRKRGRSFEALLAEGVRWPFQTAFEFPANPPDMPKMVSSRRPRGDVSFESKKMQRTVRCESVTEQRFFSKLDGLAEVLWFHEQAPTVKYEIHGNPRDYYPDAVVALRNGHVFSLEVKVCGDFALYETICKVNALTEWSHARGYGVFLGNQSSCVGDFLNKDVPRGLRCAVLTACKGPSGMSADEWRSIRTWFRHRYRMPSSWLQALAFSERLVITEEPFNVRHAAPTEEKQMEAFLRRFEVNAPLLPLSAPIARAGSASAEAAEN